MIYPIREKDKVLYEQFLTFREKLEFAREEELRKKKEK